MLLSTLSRYSTRQQTRIFFFSSGRRHTRSLCDWSSDVCSSDLADALAAREQLRALDAELAPVARLKQEVAALEGLQRETATRRTEEAQLAELARNIRMLERRLTELGDVPESLTRADAAARELHE